jgi:hypothetical protein
LGIKKYSGTQGKTIEFKMKAHPETKDMKLLKRELDN